MRPIYTADCETDPFLKGRIPEPFIWGVYGENRYRQFENTTDFVNFIKRKDCIVYAHNGGKFDWHYVTEYIPAFTPLHIINGRLSKFKIGRAEFRDSYNIIPMPLAAYKKDNIDYAIFEKKERYKAHNWQTICDYLRSDCVYLYELIERFVDDYGLHLTQAGASMKYWEKMIGHKEDRSSPEYYDALKKYYYGGRVEPFTGGEINRQFYVIDINSAYPFAMMDNHPYGLDYEEVSKGIVENQDFVTLRCISSGAFPFRTKDGLSFPNDNIERVFHVTGWEYNTAMELGLIYNPEIKSIIKYENRINFSSYITYFYNLRKKSKLEGDKAGDLFAKLFMNSLYGKFGANPDNYSEYMTVPLDHIEGSNADGYEFYNELSKECAIVFKDLDKDKQRFYNVGVAASITGFVRAHLLKAMSRVSGVLYCDTDSIVCENLRDLELDSTELGMWDLEAKCSYGAIAGKKLYAFFGAVKDGKKWKEKQWKIASKGARLEPDEIIAVAKGETFLYESETPNFSVRFGKRFIDRKIKATI